MSLFIIWEAWRRSWWNCLMCGLDKQNLDVSNSSAWRDASGYRSVLTLSSPLLSFLDETATWIKTWRVKNREGKDVTGRFRFINEVLMDIVAVKHLKLSQQSMVLHSCWQGNSVLTARKTPVVSSKGEEVWIRIQHALDFHRRSCKLWSTRC